jgi:hypothetical protein
MALAVDTLAPQNAAAKINLNGTFIFYPPYFIIKKPRPP